MSPVLFLVLHGGPGLEMGFPEYLYRVVLHLLAFGGIAALVFWWSSAVEAGDSAPATERDGEANER